MKQIPVHYALCLVTLITCKCIAVHLCLCCFFMRERERDVYNYMRVVHMDMLFPEERDLCSSSQVDFHTQTSHPFVA